MGAVDPDTFSGHQKDGRTECGVDYDEATKKLIEYSERDDDPIEQIALHIDAAEE